MVEEFNSQPGELNWETLQNPRKEKKTKKEKEEKKG